MKRRATQYQNVESIIDRKRRKWNPELIVEKVKVQPYSCIESFQSSGTGSLGIPLPKCDKIRK